MIGFGLENPNIQVVSPETIVDTSGWEYFSMQAERDELLSFLTDSPRVHKVELSKPIEWKVISIDAQESTVSEPLGMFFFKVIWGRGIFCQTWLLSTDYTTLPLIPPIKREGLIFFLNGKTLSFFLSRSSNPWYRRCASRILRSSGKGGIVFWEGSSNEVSTFWARGKKNSFILYFPPSMRRTNVYRRDNDLTWPTDL